MLCARLRMALCYCIFLYYVQLGIEQKKNLHPSSYLIVIMAIISSVNVFIEWGGIVGLRVIQFYLIFNVSDIVFKLKLNENKIQ